MIHQQGGNSSHCHTVVLFKVRLKFKVHFPRRPMRKDKDCPRLDIVNKNHMLFVNKMAQARRNGKKLGGLGARKTI